MTARVERMAPRNPSYGEPPTACGAVAIHRLDRVRTARRCEPAAGREQRRQVGPVRAKRRDDQLAAGHMRAR